MSNVDPTWLEGIVANGRWTLERPPYVMNLTTIQAMLGTAAAAGESGLAMIDAFLDQIASEPKFATSASGAHIRNLCRCARFKALRPASAALRHVMPDVFGADVRHLANMDDVLGWGDDWAGDLTKAQTQKLFFAWAPYDWDGALGVENQFGSEPPYASIEKRAWPELVQYVKQTSLNRLIMGESYRRSVTRLFAREEPIADRIALAENIAAFAKTQSMNGRDAMQVVLAALAPHVDANPLPKQLRTWIGKLAKSKSADEQALAERFESSIA